MKFNYQARTKTGEIQSGIVEASSREAAVILLKSHNLYVTWLEKASTPLYAKKIKFFEKISKKEIVLFSRQLAIMSKSEIPLTEIFATLAKQTQNPVLEEKILDMLEKVEGGTPLSKTFSFYPEIFSPFYINMVKSGEVAGKLSETFLHLADYLEREYNFSEKIKGMMVYPIFLCFVFLAVLGIMIFFLVPQITNLLAETKAEISGITEFLIGLPGFLQKWARAFILFFLALIIFIFFYLRTEEGKNFLDRNLLKLPVVGDFLKKIYLSRLAHNLSTLISGGIPIIQALEITSEVVGNKVYKSIILETMEGVKRGEQISFLLSLFPKEIPPLFIQMLVVGEKTGKMKTVLINVVDFYQKEVDRGLENFLRLLEPILIVVFGVLISALMGIVLTSLYQAISGI